jgi:hypothetical protein
MGAAVVDSQERPTYSDDGRPQPEEGSVEAGEVEGAAGEGSAGEQQRQQVGGCAAVGQAADGLGQDVARRVQHTAQLRPRSFAVGGRMAAAVLRRGHSTSVRHDRSGAVSR